MNQNSQQALKDRLGKMTAQERKKITQEAAALRERAQRNGGKPAGSMEDWIAKILSDREPVHPATVVGIEATVCRVRVGDEVQTLPMTPGERPVVGDEVELGRGRVLRVLPRRTSLSKPDDHRGGRPQVLVANIDRVVVVLSVKEPPLHPRIVDRYLFAIRQGGAEPILCVNKLDLLEVGEVSSELAKLDPYRDLGIPVVGVSAQDHEGLDGLRAVLAGTRCVFVGHSGVGKSSILNALLGSVAAREGSVNAKTGKGRHTTTQAALHRLDPGIEIIDTAGVRSFGVDASSEVEDGFPDLAEWAPNCRFPGCKHLDESGCAVKAAVRRGALSRERYIAYRRIVHGDPTVGEGFVCAHCGAYASAQGAGTGHRNHCPRCLWSLHVDTVPGDRAAACGGEMEPVTVWVRGDGEWAVIHRCSDCGHFSSNRVAADDNEMLLLSIAAKPISRPPFPLDVEEEVPRQ